MNVDEVTSRLQEIVIDRLDVDAEKITNNASFVEDLGADSPWISWSLSWESKEEFDIEIPDEDAEKLTNVGEALEYIKEKAWNRRVAHIISESGGNLFPPPSVLPWEERHINRSLRYEKRP